MRVFIDMHDIARGDAVGRPNGGDVAAWHYDRLNAEIPREARRVDRTGPAEREQDEVARINARRHHCALDEIGHVGFGNANDASRRRVCIQPKFLAERAKSGGRRGTIQFGRRIVVSSELTADT